MTFAEILLVLDRAGHRRARELLAETRSRYLASAAKWSQAAAKSYGVFADELLRELGVTPPAPAKPSRSQLAALFGALGIPEQKGAN